MPNNVSPPIVTEDIIDNSSFSISFKPVETLPELAVTFTRIGELYRDDEDFIFQKHIYLCALTQLDMVLQSFEIESAELLCPLDVDFLDMDFDGYLDMSVVWFAGNVNRTYNFFRYDIERSVFENTPFFSAGCNGIALYPNTKQIIVTAHDSVVCYEREAYQYADGEYTFIRREYAEVIESEPLTCSLHIKQYNDEGDFTEIFTTILTEEEYYGDFEIRNNYLLYGVGDVGEKHTPTD